MLGKLSRSRFQYTNDLGLRLIKNQTGSPLKKYQIVQVIGVNAEPDADPGHPFFHFQCLKGEVPTSASRDETVAIAVMQQGCPNEEFAPGMVIGVTVCKIDVSDPEHKFARPAETVEHFESHESKGFPVVWKESIPQGETGVVNALVALSGQTEGQACQWMRARCDGAVSIETAEFDATVTECELDPAIIGETFTIINPLDSEGGTKHGWAFKEGDFITCIGPYVVNETDPTLNKWLVIDGPCETLYDQTQNPPTSINTELDGGITPPVSSASLGTIPANAPGITVAILSADDLDLPYDTHQFGIVGDPKGFFVEGLNLLKVNDEFGLAADDSPYTIQVGVIDAGGRFYSESQTWSVAAVAAAGRFAMDRVVTDATGGTGENHILDHVFFTPSDTVEQIAAPSSLLTWNYDDFQISSANSGDTQSIAIPSLTADVQVAGQSLFANNDEIAVIRSGNLKYSFPMILIADILPVFGRFEIRAATGNERAELLGLAWPHIILTVVMYDNSGVLNGTVIRQIDISPVGTVQQELYATLTENLDIVSDANYTKPIVISGAYTITQEQMNAVAGPLRIGAIVTVTSHSATFQSDITVRCDTQDVFQSANFLELTERSPEAESIPPGTYRNGDIALNVGDKTYFTVRNTGDGVLNITSIVDPGSMFTSITPTSAAIPVDGVQVFEGTHDIPGGAHVSALEFHHDGDQYGESPSPYIITLDYSETPGGP